VDEPLHQQHLAPVLGILGDHQHFLRRLGLQDTLARGDANLEEMAGTRWDTGRWPFQVPKLEVPTIYKAYVRPM